MSRKLTRSTAAALMAAAAVALVPTAAGAATVGRINGVDDPYLAGNDKLVYNGSGGSSQLTILHGNGYYQFHDSGETVSPGDNSCHVVDTHTVQCKDYSFGVAGKVRLIYAWTWGGNDSIDAQVDIPTSLDGGKGNDSLRGGSDDDSLYGEEGKDDLHGNGGYDKLDGGAGKDTLLGGDQNDDLKGGTENDTLDGGAGADEIAGGTGDSDTVDYSIRQNGVTVDLDGADADDGAPGEHDSVGLDVEDIIGGKGSDTLTGNAFVNYIDAGSGNDKVYGLDGGDHVTGGAGNDVEDGGAGNDSLDGGLGNDTLLGGADDDALDGGVGSDLTDGGPGKDSVGYYTRTAPVTITLDGVKNDGVAGELDNVLADNEYVSGGSGDDKITGGPGDEILFGNDGNDTLDGDLGADYLAAGKGDDTLLSRDGIKDTDSCGLGTDTVTADDLDVLKACETVDLPAKPDNANNNGNGNGNGGNNGNAGGAQQPGAGNGQSAGAAKLTIGPGRVRLSRTRVATLRVSCPAGAGVCQGTLVLRKRIHGHLRTIGKHSFSIAAGKSQIVKVKVNRSAAKRARHGLEVTASTGGVTRTITLTRR